MVEARVLRRWIFLWTIWMLASRLDQTHVKQRILARVEERNINYFTCLVSTVDIRGALLKSDV